MAGYAMGKSKFQTEDDTPSMPCADIPFYLRRCWRQPGLPHTRESRSIRLLCYNILADSLVNPTHYPSVDGALLTWEYRKANILNELDYWHADVACLQEVDGGEMWADIRGAMEDNGYVGRHKQRSGDKSDGCATFWLASRWRLIECREVDFLGVGGLAIMDRDNVALVVVLEDIRCPTEVGRQLIVANTHLLFNAKRGDVKLCQLHHLMHVVNELYSAAVTRSRRLGCGLPAVVVEGKMPSRHAFP
jgi:mRNA deadenylase 3'-5' endonuclease subunit Ccr4